MFGTVRLIGYFYMWFFFSGTLNEQFSYPQWL